jgi:hypothetical protein
VLAERSGAPTAIGRGLRVAAAVHGDSDVLEESCAVLEQTPDGLELARSLTKLGAAHRLSGQP